MKPLKPELHDSQKQLSIVGDKWKICQMQVKRELVLAGNCGTHGSGGHDGSDILQLSETDSKALLG